MSINSPWSTSVFFRVTFVEMVGFIYCSFPNRSHWCTCLKKKATSSACLKAICQGMSRLVMWWMLKQQSINKTKTIIQQVRRRICLFPKVEKVYSVLLLLTPFPLSSYIGAFWFIRGCSWQWNSPRYLRLSCFVGRGDGKGSVGAVCFLTPSPLASLVWCLRLLGFANHDS